MKLQALKIESSSEGFDTADFGMETNDPAVIQILLEGIYPSPYVWPRELIANWADAGGGGELLLPDKLDPNWTIEDHGPGMTDQFMAKNYTMIFHSTKRDSDEKTGGFGHGRLSPLAYVETYSVRSRYMDEESGQIMEGNYIVFKNEVRVPRIARVSLAPSEVQQTGVTVTIPIADADINTIVERTKFYASYTPTPPKGFEKLEYRFQNGTGGLRMANNRGDMQGIRLILAGIPYPVPTETRLPNVEIDLFFEGGELQPTLSREGINADNTILALIKERYAQFIEQYRNHITADLATKKSLFEKYKTFTQVAEALPYGLRSIVFPSSYSQTFSNLPIATIYSSLKGDFNLHQIVSDTDKYSYEGLDLETKTLKSLVGLRIKSLTGTGVAQRKSGQDFATNQEVLEFQNLVRRKYSNKAVDSPQVVIFGIKAPYVTGQIKLIKEAIAAKLTDLRQADALGSYGTAMLLQYEDEADVKRLTDLFLPDEKPIIITDLSKRAASQQYISVTTASANTYSRTHPMKLSVLNSPDKVFVIRKPDWRAHDIHNRLMDTLRKMPLFSGKTLVVIAEGDAKLLDAGYNVAENMIHDHIRKKWGYPLDTTLINNQMGNANSVKRQIENHILNYRVGPENGQARPRLLDLLAAKEELKGDTVLQAALKLENSIDNLDLLSRIYGFASTIGALIKWDFFVTPPKGGNRPLPVVSDEAVGVVQAFQDRFPMIKLIMANSYRSYGFNTEDAAVIIDYIETVNRNCPNV